MNTSSMKTEKNFPAEVYSFSFKGSMPQLFMRSRVSELAKLPPIFLNENMLMVMEMPKRIIARNNTM